MDVTSSGWIRSAFAALTVVSVLLPLAGPATAAEPTVEVTLVHAFAPGSRSDTDIGPRGDVELDVFLDGELIAPGLELGTAMVLPDLLTPGTHNVSIALPGEDILIQEQDIDIPDTPSVDVAIGNSPGGGAGLPFIMAFANDLSPVPAGSTSVVLRNLADEYAVSVGIPEQATPEELIEVLRGEEGEATVPAGFTEISLIPSTCPISCISLLQREFPAEARTIVYAVGDAREGFQDSNFEGVSRVLGQEGGVLTVAKVLQGQPAGFTAVFAVDVVCQAPGSSRTLQLPAGLALTFGGIPSGVACTVNEPVPPAAAAGWGWAAPVLDPADGTVVLQRGKPARVTVTNGMVGLPAVKLVKSAGVDGFHQVGDVIDYRFTATNTGGTALSGVRVSDPMPGLSAVSCGSGELAPGASMVCEARYLVTDADVAAGVVRNTATVTGTDPQGVAVTDSDTLEVSRHLVDTGAGAPVVVVAWALLLVVAGTGLLRQVRHRTSG